VGTLRVPIIWLWPHHGGDYSTINGSATDGSDYVGKSGSIVFNPGETKKTLTFSIRGDTLPEGDETFVVSLSNPQGAKLADGKATVTITDDDGNTPPPPASLPKLSLSGGSLDEGDEGQSNATVTVQLSAASSLPVTVNYASADGTATAGSDYQAVNGTLNFAPGETRKTINVPIFGDTLKENDETVSVSLSAPSNATLGNASATITILDDSHDCSESLVGTAGDDVLDGHECNDTLQGMAGNDTLSGDIGDDSLMGGNGNDVLLSGDGDDVLMDAGGNDTLSGGLGDDRFVLNGSGVGNVLIEDTGGNDTLDVSGAAAGVKINLTPGQASTVGGQTITLSSGGKLSDPLDVYFLQDLTGSFRDDIATVNTLVPQVAAAIDAFQPDSLVGLGTFMDKPLPPLGSANDFVYKNNLGLTDDQAAFSSALNALKIGDGNDLPEAQLEALMQVALHSEEIGFRGDSVKVVVLMTDAPYHVSGDGGQGGITTPNDGDATMNGKPAGTGEDYPSVAMVGAALDAAGILPIFAVTSDDVATYEQLVEQLGIGSVVTLSSDSANLVSVITSGITDLTIATVENATGSAYADTLNGDANPNTLKGQGGADTLKGGNGNDTLLGGDGKDQLSGEAGNDLLDGGTYADTLTGGGGSDRFVFAAGDSGVGAGNRDTISDFNPTTNGELIDLSQLAATPLSFIGTAAFGAAGQVRYAKDEAAGTTLVQINLDNSPGTVEMEIQLAGAITLDGGDFFLD
jgi:Ca2+-binding RTX toxin-like protein